MDLPHNKLCRLSAAFAISNMGQTVPKDIAERISDSPYCTPRSEIDNFAGHLMETDEHEEIFAGEAEMWYDLLKKKAAEEVLYIHGKGCPWVKQIIDA